jgi:cytoskeletal protein CcmA (bactofilin family)
MSDPTNTTSSTPIQGYQPSVFQLDPVEHNIKHHFDVDAVVKGGSLTFAKGVHISGQVSECDSLVCAGTLIIGENAKVNAKHIHAQVLINLGELISEKITIPGTLVAWSGSISGGVIQYAAMEKSSLCKIKGALEDYEPEAKHQSVKAPLMAVGA